MPWVSRLKPCEGNAPGRVPPRDWRRQKVRRRRRIREKTGNGGISRKGNSPAASVTSLPPAGRSLLLSGSPRAPAGTSLLLSGTSLPVKGSSPAPAGSSLLAPEQKSGTGSRKAGQAEKRDRSKLRPPRG